MTLRLLPHEWLRQVREDKGIRQTDVETRSTELGQRISQSHLSKIEKGASPLAGLGAAKLDVLRRVLGIPVDVWLHHTGLELVTPSALSAAALYDLPEEEEEEVIDLALLAAADKYGSDPEFSDIKHPAWLSFLNRTDFRQRPTTPEQWLSKFIKYREDIDPTRGGEGH